MDIVPKKIQTDQEQHDQKKVKKEFFVQTQKRLKNSKLWEFDPDTGILINIPYPKSTVEVFKKNAQKPNRAKQYMKENHMYFQAMNRRNAIRKLNNRGYVVQFQTPRKAEKDLLG